MKQLKELGQAVWHLICAICERVAPWLKICAVWIFTYLRIVARKIDIFLRRQMKKHPGGSFSLGLHLLILLLVVGDISALFEELPPEVKVISLQMAPIMEKTLQSPPPKKEEPVSKPVEKPQPKAEKVQEKVKEPPVSPVSGISSKPKAPKAVKKPTSKPKKESTRKSPKITRLTKPKNLITPKRSKKPKKVVKKPAPTKPKPKPILKNLAKEEPKSLDKASKTLDTPVTNAPQDLALSLSEMDLIFAQMSGCWNDKPMYLKDAATIFVEVQVKYHKNGKLNGTPKVVGGKRSHPSFATMAESVERAIHKCNPLKNMPADKYNTWKEMILVFDPSEMGS